MITINHCNCFEIVSLVIFDTKKRLVITGVMPPSKKDFFIFTLFIPSEYQEWLSTTRNKSLRKYPKITFQVTYYLYISRTFCRWKHIDLLWRHSQHTHNQCLPNKISDNLTQDREGGFGKKYI
jgi:hypothetical protein